MPRSTPASEPHVFIAEAAEKVREAAQETELQEWARKLLETLPDDAPPLLPQTGFRPFEYECCCPPYSTCMSVMCPRRTRITC